MGQQWREAGTYYIHTTYIHRWIYTQIYVTYFHGGMAWHGCNDSPYLSRQTPRQKEFAASLCVYVSMSLCLYVCLHVCLHVPLPLPRLHVSYSRQLGAVAPLDLNLMYLTLT